MCVYYTFSHCPKCPNAALPLTLALVPAPSGAPSAPPRTLSTLKLPDQRDNALGARLEPPSKITPMPSNMCASSLLTLADPPARHPPAS